MIRGVGLRSAVAINVATMIGAGPLITIPLVVVALHGSVSVTAWIVGALVALCDGLVYAELASLFPRAGGTYAYVREAFGAAGPGRLLAFLFVWQYCFWAPLTLATGYIGFAQYAGFVVPVFATNLVAQKGLAIGVGVVTLIALYRAIPTIARTAYVLGAVALGTLAVVALAGLAHAHVAFTALAPQTLSVGGFGIGAFGAALVITLYDYGGYNDVCLIAEEVRAPTRTIPLAIVISVAAVAAAYVALNLGIFSTLPIAEVAKSTSVASDVIDRTLGHTAAVVVTLAILVTAFASTYGLLLGAARVPFAAARDGDFLPAFAALHPTAKFPARSLVAIGLLALPASLLPLDAVIAALTAGIVLVQGVAQVVALLLLRARNARAPFRSPLFPVPPLIALAGWVFLFLSSGTPAIVFGCATLALGAIVFLWRARIARQWPFAVAAGLAVALALTPRMPAGAQTFTHAAVVDRGGSPALVVDGEPFFFYGAAFFYERIPPSQWKASMDALRAMGFNTLDLYVPWNWHELADGDFDFTGRTSPRRNLRALVQLIRASDFRVVLRPGPVIRNEWRNGGYPAWLLARPEYGMPLHDVLEGRYPATATLQNANADDAAAEWMGNATHMRYATRWLETALREFQPVADRVIAVQLDDDQGAYIDNQTWPAPHLQTYLRQLETVVRGIVGRQLPVFINTYEMKVTASAPVWAMGNWYQSDAYAIGEHDRAALEFSTGLLQTQQRWPVAMSEFQAGWLAQPEDPTPRPADPANTTLALHTLLQMGTRGVIDFPAQDTVNPAGWEAPFANARYAWDAALGTDLAPSARYEPTARFGRLVERYGAELATARRVADGAIAYLTSAYPERDLRNADVFAVAARTQEAQRGCRAARLTCDLVDLRFSSDAALARYPFLIVPPAGVKLALLPDVRMRLERYRIRGGRLAAVPPLAARPGALADATLLQAADGAVFLDIVNYDAVEKRLPATSLALPGGRSVRAGPFVVPARDALLARIAARTPPVALVPAPAPTAVPVPACLAQPPAGAAAAWADDEAEDGYPRVHIANRVLTLTLTPAAGARATSLRRAGDACHDDADAFTSVGALRDDVLVQPPLSTTDRIAKYTRSFPAGMFNRPYATEMLKAGPDAAAVRFSYDAPDVVPAGAHFERTLTLAAAEHHAVVDERVTFGGDAARAAAQRAVVLSSFDTRNATILDQRSDGGVGFYDARTKLLATLAWRRGDIVDATLLAERTSTVVRLVAAPGGMRRTLYGLYDARNLDEARTILGKERDAASAKR